MMEVVEPSVVPYMHTGRQDQLHAPLDWSIGSMGSMDDFLDFSTGVTNDFAPQMDGEALEADSLSQGGNAPNYGWNDTIPDSNKNAHFLAAQHNAAGYIVDTKAILQPTVTAVEVTGMPGYAEEHTHVNNGVAMVPFDAANLPQVAQSWAEGAQYDEEGAPLNPTLQHTPSFGTMLANIFEVVDLPGPVPPLIPEDTLQNALGISGATYRNDVSVDPPMLVDEMPQYGYAQITDTPSLYGSGQPDTGAWSHPTHNSFDSVVSYPAADPALGGIDIEGILFSNQIPVIDMLQAQPHHFVDHTLLALPSTDFQSGQSPRDGPVTHLSPSTPQRANDLRITPSPNFIISGLPEPIFDSTFHPMTNAFGPLIGCVPPPPQSDMMNNFESSAEPLSKKRKRKAFNNEDKRKVNLVRENGACVACHARKVSCTTNGTCSGCFKVAAENPELAQQICLRTRLKDVYMSVKDIHNTLDLRERRLAPLIESLTGPSTPIHLTVANHKAGYRFQLNLEVKACASSPSCRWKRLTKINGIYVTKDFIQAQRFVIVPSSLPSTEKYDQFGRQILAMSNGSHSGSLTQLLDEFLIAYCEHSTPSRLRNFAHATLSMASLSRLVAYGFLNIYDGAYELLDRHTGSPITEDSATRRYVSETVHDQLRILAAKGLEPKEKQVFADIDNLNKLFGKVPNGRIVSGICVLRLMLLYRDRVVRDKIRQGLPRSGDQHKIRLGKAAFMYKRLTIAYSTLCRETSPLRMHWKEDDQLGRNQQYQTMVEKLKVLEPAFLEFCENKVKHDYDELFSELIIPMLSMEKKPVKKRKVEKGRVEECHDH